MRLAPLLLLAACATADRRVATLPADVNDWWVGISRDGSTAAYVDRQGAQVVLVVGERRYGPFV